MKRGEKLAATGMICTFIAGLAFDGSYWWVGIIIITICLLIMATGWAIYHAQYARRELMKEIRMRQAEEAEKTKLENKNVTFRNWMATRVTY